MDSMENDRVPLTIRESDGDQQSFDSGVGNDPDLSQSLSWYLDNPSTPLPDCHTESKPSQRDESAPGVSDSDSFEAEFTGVLGRLDGLIVQVKGAAKAAENMIEMNCKRAESLNRCFDDMCSAIRNPVASVPLQSSSDVAPRGVSSDWEGKQSVRANETKVTACATSLPSLPQKTVNDHIGRKNNSPKILATPMDIQKMLLAANERTKSPSFYETQVKVPLSKVTLVIDEKSVPPKITKRTGKNRKKNFIESEASQPLLTKQDVQKPDGFKSSNCQDKNTKDVLPPITGLNRNQKYIQAREQIFSAIDDQKKSSKKRMAKIGIVESVQKQEKKVPRTTLDYCEARLGSSFSQGSAALPPVVGANNKPQIKRKLGEEMAGYSSGRQPLTPINRKPGGLLPDIPVKNRLSNDERAFPGGHMNGAGAGRDRCSMSLSDISPRMDEAPFLPILEANGSLAAPNAPLVLPSILKPKRIQKMSEVPQLPQISQHLPIIMPNRVQPKKPDKMPNRYVTWLPKNAGSLRAKNLESAEVLENTEDSNKQTKPLLPLLPNRQNASQFLRKQSNKKPKGYRYF